MAATDVADFIGTMTPSVCDAPPVATNEPYSPSSQEEIKLLLLLEKTEDRVSGLAAKGTAEGDLKVHFYVQQLASWLDRLETHPQ